MLALHLNIVKIRFVDMNAGDVVIDDTETFTITRSAGEGGPCHFELELAPGASGPPTHTHDEPESFEVLSGAIVFWLDGVEKRFSAGESFVIPPGCAHTFENASKTDVVRARGTHGGAFERLIDQLAAGGPRFLRLSLYLSTVDPRASYMVSPVVRGTMHAAAVLAKLLRVKVAPATGPYGTLERAR
jgi:mannose-6-phosphate isomerase-like protein (cupin superfamily)